MRDIRLLLRTSISRVQMPAELHQVTDALHKRGVKAGSEMTLLLKQGHAEMLPTGGHLKELAIQYAIDICNVQRQTLVHESDWAGLDSDLFDFELELLDSRQIQLDYMLEATKAGLGAITSDG